MILNHVFQKTYVINLKESIDRKNHIIKEFERVGINNYEFFEATHYDDPCVKKFIDEEKVISFPPCFRCGMNRCSCENNFLTKFQIANWISYMNLFQKILNEDNKTILICEDDIVFSHQYKRIINNLLSKRSIERNKINFNKPLLIRFGTAFNPVNHNSLDAPRFLRNYSLCNPCFGINKNMAYIFLKYSKIMDYHSDVYIHKKIPQQISGIQFMTMYPYPVYELSFVEYKKQFDSLIRPKNQIRRKEYKDFLFITSNKLLEIIPLKFAKKLNLQLDKKKIGFNGNINSFLFFDNEIQEKYYFKYKIFIKDSKDFDLQFINNNIINEHIIDFIKSIIDKNNLKININDLNDVKDNLEQIYDTYLLMIKEEDFSIYDINNIDETNINKELLSSMNYYNDVKKSIWTSSETSLAISN